MNMSNTSSLLCTRIAATYRLQGVMVVEKHGGIVLCAWRDQLLECTKHVAETCTGRVCDQLHYLL